MAKGPPPKPSSDSAVMASTSAKSSKRSPVAKNENPSLAESIGKKAPEKKASSVPSKGEINSLESEGSLYA